MKYEIYRDRRDEWRWRLKARNGKILAVSSEGYTYKLDCFDCMNHTRNSRAAPVVEL